MAVFGAKYLQGAKIGRRFTLFAGTSRPLPARAARTC
jgi:hypothetical protein